MLGGRSDQRGLWEADQLYLDLVGKHTFYGLFRAPRRWCSRAVLDRTAQAASETRVPGNEDSGRGSRSRCPRARDGDGNSVVCEQYRLTPFGLR